MDSANGTATLDELAAATAAQSAPSGDVSPDVYMVGNRLLLRESEKPTSSPIIMVDHDRDVMAGEVLRVGPGLHNPASGTLVPTQAQVGDTVFFNPGQAVKLRLDLGCGKFDYYVISEELVLAGWRGAQGDA